MEKQDAKIISWLEENDGDSEEADLQSLEEDITESDRESEHSAHNTDTEQSVESLGEDSLSISQEIRNISVPIVGSSRGRGQERMCTASVAEPSQRPSGGRGRRTTAVPRSRSRSPVVIPSQNTQRSSRGRGRGRPSRGRGRGRRITAVSSSRNRSPVVVPSQSTQPQRPLRGRRRRTTAVPRSHSRSPVVVSSESTPPQRPSRSRRPRTPAVPRSRSRSPVIVPSPKSQRPSRGRERSTTAVSRSHSRSPVTVTRSRSRSSDVVSSQRQSHSHEPTSSEDDEPLARLINRNTSAAEPRNSLIETATQQRQPRVPMYKGRDGTKWLVHPSTRPNIRTRQENIVINRPGVQGQEANNAKTPKECFDLFLTNSMLEDIVKFTNAHIQAQKLKFSRERDTKETDITEIEALIGLLLIAGLKKINRSNVQEMWSSDGTAPDIFRASMSIKRFYFLMRNLRFDDMQTRTERAPFDNLAALRDMFETFVSNCQKHYQVGEYCTIDEMLESFRGRCKFRVYMANKPAKYGVKMYALVDSQSFYTSNLEVYTGKQPEGQFKVDNSPSALVKRLSHNILNTGRNITMDNYFTSIPLADQLINDHRTTIVGTLRKNKREIPPRFLATKDRAKPSTLFGFNEKKVLVSYVPKKKTKKIVLLVSTLHDDDKIDESTGDKAKPEIITFYNKNKGGVDVVDQMKEEYSAGRMTRRWPMRLFFSILNIAGINSQIIYKANTNHLMLRRLYLKDISLALIKPHLTRRSSVLTLSRSLKSQISRFIAPEDQPSTSGREGICMVCPSKKNRRTRKGCNVCSKLLCNEHCMFMCEDCFAQTYDVDLENM